MAVFLRNLFIGGIPKLGLYRTRLGTIERSRQIHTQAFPLLFRASPMLSAEPLKKKRKIDPAVLKMREDRKKRKLEKEIRKLEKVGQKLKPIEELEVPPKLLQEKNMRNRKVAITNEDNRVTLTKEWGRYKTQQHIAETTMIYRIMEFQTLALDELKLESQELYEEALQPDATLIPFSAVGPANTPPIEAYVKLDGEYLDITKKWD